MAEAAARNSNKAIGALGLPGLRRSLSGHSFRLKKQSDAHNGKEILGFPMGGLPFRAMDEGESLAVDHPIRSFAKAKHSGSGKLNLILPACD
jgi:hypothetical protein